MLCQVNPLNFKFLLPLKKKKKKKYVHISGVLVLYSILINCHGIDMGIQIPLKTQRVHYDYTTACCFKSAKVDLLTLNCACLPLLFAA